MKIFENINKIFGVQRSGELRPKEKFEIFKPINQELNNQNQIRRRKPKLRIHFFNSSHFKEGRWEEEEHRLFVKSCLIYGNNWRKVNSLFKILFLGSERYKNTVLGSNKIPRPKVCY
jgi:hypothetical protein